MTCRVCHPEAYASGPRLHEGHFAVRFGDQDRIWFLWAICDGVEVRHIREVCPGQGGDLGWIEYIPWPPARCACGEGIETAMVRGDVRIALIPYEGG